MANNHSMHPLEEMILLMKENLDHIVIESASRWSNTGWITPESGNNNYFEIIYAVSGTRVMEMPGQTLNYQAGDLQFIDSSDESVCRNGEFSYDYIIFGIDRNHRAYSQVYEKMKHIFAHLRMLPQSQFRTNNEWLKKQFRLISLEFITQKKYGKFSMMLLIFQLLINLNRQMEAELQMEDPDFISRYSGIVTDLITYLSENLDKDIRLSDLAIKYNFNPRYLNKIFKKVIGIPIFQYQKILKIDKAKKLLRSTSMSNLDIALELCFESSQYLNYFFKKETSMTPNQYKKMNK